MIKKYTYFIFVLAFLSCQSLDKAAKPKILLEEDKMVEILTDIAFIKAAKSSHKRFLEENKINPQAYILQKHDIDSVVFAENNIWYAAQLEEYEKIFNRVKANLNTSKKKYEKLKKEEDSIKKREDSIKKANDTLMTKGHMLKKDKNRIKRTIKAPGLKKE